GCGRGLAQPVAQLAVQLGQELLRFFLEDREQLEVDGIDGVDLVVNLAEGGGPPRRGAPARGGRRGERLELGDAEGVEAAEAAEDGRRGFEAVAGTLRDVACPPCRREGCRCGAGR